MKRILTYTVPQGFCGARINDALRRGMKMSGSLIKELKAQEDGIMQNGRRARTTDTVNSGDIIVCTLYDTDPENITPTAMQLDILYEDEDILIINKPPHMPVHPTKGHITDTLANGVIAHYRDNGEAHPFRAVNRLDSDTSGVMCIAKNSYANARLCDEIASGGLRREYVAIVEGTLNESGTVNAPIARINYLKRAVREDGQNAVTHYEPIAGCGSYTLLRLRLEMGRTHQIRVHMQHIGHPLLGDWLYGTENKELFPRHALHSRYLRLTHPVTGKDMEFAAPLPEDMDRFIKGTGMQKNKEEEKWQE